MKATIAAVPRITKIDAHVRVPGDKSISHRYAMLAGLAHGVSRLRGYAPGADCASTLTCLAAFGVSITRTGPADVQIEGRGLGGLLAPASPIDAGNSGTSMRLLAGIAAGHRFRTVLTGDASLSRRPMRRVIEPLTRMGAVVGSSDGRPPLVIDGGALHAIVHEPSIPSAQVKSAVLLAGLHAAGTTRVVEPAPTRDHTERALEAFGVRVATDGPSVAIDGGQPLAARDLTVPGDLSSAVFWLVLAAGHPGSQLRVDGVGLNPSRTRVLDILRRAGAAVDVSVDAQAAGEPIGTIHLRGGRLDSFVVEPAEVPGVIDELPALAAMAAMQPGTTMTVRGAAELRVKETDRIAVLAQGFRAIGVRVTEFDDGFTIEGGPPTSGAPDAGGDHRLAMAFAIAGTAAAGPVTVAGAHAVDVSYPGFFEELDRLAGRRDGR